jgi:hypothetical protein
MASQTADANGEEHVHTTTPDLAHMESQAWSGLVAEHGVF